MNKSWNEFSIYGDVLYEGGGVLFIILQVKMISLINYKSNIFLFNLIIHH